MADKFDSKFKPHDYKVWVDDSWAKEGQKEHFTIKLDKPADHTIHIDYYTVNGGAKAGQDYEYTKGTVTFHKGEWQEHVYVETYKDKHYPEGTEKFYLKIDEHDPHVRIKDHGEKGEGKIYDVKPEQPKVYVYGDEKTEGEYIKVKFHVVGDNKDGVHVKWHTEADTANDHGKHDNDYKPSGGKGHDVYIKPGDHDEYVYIKTYDDKIDEHKEHFKVVLDHGDYKNGNDYANCYIKDNDTQPHPTFTGNDHPLV